MIVHHGCTTVIVTVVHDCIYHDWLLWRCFMTVHKGNHHCYTSWQYARIRPVTAINESILWLSSFLFRVTVHHDYSQRLFTVTSKDLQFDYKQTSHNIKYAIIIHTETNTPTIIVYKLDPKLYEITAHPMIVSLYKMAACSDRFSMTLTASPGGDHPEHSNRITRIWICPDPSSMTSPDHVTEYELIVKICPLRRKSKWPTTMAAVWMADRAIICDNNQI